ITVEVTPNDGTLNGTKVSASATVVDTAPVIDSVVIDQANPKTNDTLSVTVVSHDDDGDAVTYSYQWHKNGSPISGAVGATLNLATAGNGDKGDQISVTVTPTAASVNGSAVTAAAVTVQTTAPAANAASAPVAHRSSAGVAIPLSASDADATDTLTYSLVGANGGALHGTVTVSGNVAHYTPTGDFVGDDTFQFKASDGSADS